MFGAIFYLWGYDLIKYRLIRDILQSQGIDPVLFLFFDMVTVPFFVIGSSCLVNALTKKAMAWPRVLAWGIIVLTNTLTPYVYAAMAGRSRFGTAAWAVFWSVVLLVLANLIRTVRPHVFNNKKL